MPLTMSDSDLRHLGDICYPLLMSDLRMSVKDSAYGGEDREYVEDLCEAIDIFEKNGYKDEEFYRSRWIDDAMKAYHAGNLEEYLGIV